MSWRTSGMPMYRLGNQASGYYTGEAPQGASRMGSGIAMAAPAQYAQGQGVTIGGTQWHPTVLYLAALIVGEMVVFGYISHLLRK